MKKHEATVRPECVGQHHRKYGLLVAGQVYEVMESEMGPGTLFEKVKSDPQPKKNKEVTNVLER